MEDQFIIYEEYNDEDYQKVEGNPHLLKEKNTGAIVNVDQNQYDAYIKNYKKVYNEKKKIKDFESEMKEMKNDINEIKDLLRSLAQNK